MQEKSIDQMTTSELRGALAEYDRSTRPAPPAAPLPPGITADMSQGAQDTASQLYAESILRKPAGSLSQAERDFLRASITPALRELGY